MPNPPEKGHRGQDRKQVSEWFSVSVSVSIKVTLFESDFDANRDPADSV
jgi:hypothetical protein